jgi:hypothetical protein
LIKLNTLAVATLRASNGDHNKAAGRLARELAENSNRALLIGLVLDYLARLRSPDSSLVCAMKIRARPNYRRVLKWLKGVRFGQLFLSFWSKRRLPHLVLFAILAWRAPIRTGVSTRPRWWSPAPS